MMRLQLLGDFELLDECGRSLKLASRKDAALLAYLALQEKPVDRAVVADLLWVDRAEEQARKSLRQSLVALRRILNRNFEIVPTDRDQRIQIDLSYIAVDASEFKHAAMTGNVELAASLYGGAFLGNFRSPTNAFDRWISAERAHLDDLSCGVLMELAQTRLTACDWTGAIQTARAIVEINHLNEGGHRLLMRALEGGGRRNDALQQFHRLNDLLRDELDVHPDTETTALYRTIKETPTQHLLADSKRGEELESKLSDRPGLVVLPLRVVENSHEDQAIADGLTEELIATLAAYRWFFVTSAIQAATYRNRQIEPRQLYNELGVRYVLSGRLRRTGNHLSVRLDLSDPLSGEHLWSERIRCHFDEALLAHDTLARQVAAAIEPELLKAEDEISLRVPLQDFKRWEQLARARRLAERGDENGLKASVELAGDIARQFPNCAYAQATLGWTSWLIFAISALDKEGYHRNLSTMPDGMAACEAAVTLDPRFYLGHAALGGWQTKVGDFSSALPNLRRSIDLNPSFPTSYNQMVGCLTRAGRPQEAFGWIKPLDLISPNDAFRGYYCCVRAVTWFYLGNDEKAVSNAEESLSRHEGWLSSELVLIAASQRLGDTEKSAMAARRLRQLRGEMTKQQLSNVFRMQRNTDFETISELLFKAGVLVA